MSDQFTQPRVTLTGYNGPSLTDRHCKLVALAEKVIRVIEGRHKHRGDFTVRRWELDLIKDAKEALI